MRNPIACVSCRSAKQKCIHRDRPPCDRCHAAGRGDSCRFAPPGTSFLHRQAKRRRQTSEFSADSADASARAAHGASSSVEGQGPPHVADGLSVPLADTDPFDLLTDEVRNSYLRCSYKWSFHHTPTFLSRVREKSLEPWVTWSVLALSVRFSRHAPGTYATPTEASNAFATHARQILQLELETPSISRIQALLMLTGHDWGAGNGRRAWFYLGMAIRMVQILNLCEETPAQPNRTPTRQEFIAAEERRRTAWTCFLMDSLLSGGKGRKRTLSAADMRIQLPCEKDMYVFGDPVRCERLDRTITAMPPPLPIGDVGIVGYSLRVADVWGEVARWACSSTMNEELPWDPDSRFQQLSASLRAWYQTLPSRLIYNTETLQAHNALEQGQAFCYMHSIHFMSLMFLHRAYLPVLGPGEEPQRAGLGTQSLSGEDWAQWRRTSRKQLFEVASMVCDMVDEMKSFGWYFLRGLVPWIGFTVYTAVGVVVYRCNFHGDEEPDQAVSDTGKEQVINGCNFLKEMKYQWPMAQQWFETIKRMQACYRRVQSEGGSSIPDAEQRTIRSAMVDYGALQPSPVQAEEEMSIQVNPEVVSNSNALGSNNQLDSPKLIDDYTNEDAFLQGEWLDFDIGVPDAELDAMFMNATQEFWATFPGEVGYS
ncbi:uncharacterized protein K452DRAFT_328996 [Aplosporella prunicola CBS 121167]|uniref:Zn(2)-C6 fungal-type domain-containing protein n=1 Tax=Aplosporella prunicola CBS 121167 TaxID=1176127 RepID=A0A6A6B398_9PEZI|nr:uncharacterized protein K452DRAFT_328996 [Aplosporella prunicola CBS 121167]KAF2138078.1 hypothetical protein K452DRAFT_328996 [Aplosporella prunicola CBS 121167]